MKIKNIIFDLGGVIIDLQPQLSIEAFGKYARKLDYLTVYHHPLFHDFETGSIDSEYFRKEMKREFGFEIEDALLDDCMNAMLGEIPRERLELLEKMKSRYKTLLLSNTNPIHYWAVTEYVKKVHGRLTFDEFFHRAYYSHLVGMRKPDVKIFEMLLKENGLVANETLYLDDTGEHLKSARSLGINTVKVTPENNVMEILKDF